MRNARLALASFAVIGIAACGSAPTTATVKTVHAPTPVSTPSGTVVRIHAGVFLPEHLVVIVGHPVKWQNFDAVARQVQATKGARFRSGVLRTGQVFSWTPKHLGKVRYRDPSEPKVIGTIVVVS